MELKGRKVLVLGLARSGLAAVRALRGLGAKVTVSDKRTEAELAEAAAGARRAGAQLALGGHPEGLLEDCQLLVLSPGVPPQLALLKEARRRGLPVWSELELAFRMASHPWAAVTGTNGKTTTTSLLYAMYQAAGVPALLGGNIGQALADRVAGAGAEDWIVAEVSSFQLEEVSSFRPRTAVITNLTPDHLDRYGGMPAYAAAKARVFENQGTGDHLVLNVKDRAVLDLAGPAKATRWLFSGSGALSGAGAWAEQGRIWLRAPGGEAQALLAADQIRIKGPHNLENALAAACMAAAAGLPWEALAQALREFPGVEHRLEACGEAGGVRFVNDSKATNVDAVEKALQSFKEPLHLILGGRDKEGDFTRLEALVRANVARLYLIGEAAAKIESQLGAAAAFERSGDLATALRSALGHARSGELILLAPGCASFDQFRDYEHRGRVFKELVASLAPQRSAA